MSANPYAPPASDVRPQHTVQIYSPTQVACGTLGGPVGLIYFLWANFSALGRTNHARKTLVLGALGLIALIALLPFLPDKGSNTVFTVLYIAIARHVAEKYQMTKAAIATASGYAFQSNWRVFGLALVCFVVSAVVIVLPLFLLDSMGIVSL